MDDSPLPPCPQCGSGLTYDDGQRHVCPECGHEWDRGGTTPPEAPAAAVVRDANGNPLADGDSVTVIKDLKVKGASSVVKVGTKVRNIRLLAEAADGHDIDCRIEGFGAMRLKSAYVRKA
ncbi:MAG: zinc ribbon domain-containing protein YjdM [Gammaproteobacteria bacterium]